MSLKAEVFNIKGKTVGKIEIPEGIPHKASVPLIHEVVTAHLANRRLGTASTKTRAEVSGGGKKPWKQKHTGRARAGSIRSPLWRHGGVAFGPRPRSFSVELSEKKKMNALRAAIADKLTCGTLKVIEDFEVKEQKTKWMADILKKLNISSKTLFVLSKYDPVMWRITNNIPFVKMQRVKDINTYDVLNADYVLISKSAMEILLDGLGPKGKEQ